MQFEEINGHDGRRRILLIATIVHRSRGLVPFASRDENASYGHLAALCAARGLDLHVTHFENLSHDESAFAWTWRGKSWRLVDLSLSDLSLCYADLPQNFAAADAFRQALADHSIRIVNALALSDLLTDKLATYRRFDEYVPLTWSTGSPDLIDCLRSMRLHSDLSVEKLVLKPRFGERGRGIYFTQLDRLAEHPALRRKDYILQAFLETRCGLPELGIDGRHDVRLILRDGEIMLAFARLPASGRFISNCCQGGRELPLTVDDLPDRVIRFAADIDSRLRHFGPRLYSLDLGVGRSGKIWIYELNTMPGIVWDHRRPENISLHQNMHHVLASWLSSALSAKTPLSADPATSPSGFLYRQSL